MTAAIPDLWPDDLIGEPTRTPVAILRRQAQALGGKTHNFVTGDVESRVTGGGQQFEHTFVLSAPLLGYHVPLLRVTHGIHSFPSTVAESDLIKVARNADKFWSRRTEKESELLDALKEFFAVEQVKNVIQSLINQSSAIEPGDN